MAKTVGVPCGIAVQLVLDGMRSRHGFACGSMGPCQRLIRYEDAGGGEGENNAGWLAGPGAFHHTGILAPMSKDIYEPILTLLEKEGIRCAEEIFDLV